MANEEFDRWWNSSKYIQVVHSGAAERQIALDAWNARAALASAAVVEREPVAFVSAMAIRHHIDSGTSQTGTVLHREQGKLYGEKHLALYLDPPPVSELEAENARLTKLLSVRDDFIVNQGLWSDFVATLPNTRRVREGGKVDG